MGTKAKKIIHDKENKTINYDNAILKIYTINQLLIFQIFLIQIQL